MCQKLLGDATLYALLSQIDADLASGVKSEGCLVCGGPLHQANYPRKPRGGPSNLGPDYGWRLSLCCGAEGCRKRRTPPSVRFLGRRVYLGVVVVLVTVLQSGLSPRRFQELREHLEVDRRTVERWRRWWRETLPAGPFWREVKGRLATFVSPAALPAALLEHFAGDERTRFVSLLRFLSPLATASAAGVGAR